jgi:hypothetical protein
MPGTAWVLASRHTGEYDAHLAMEIETHIKTVKGKTVLVPSLALFKQHLTDHSRFVDTLRLRQSLTKAYGTQLVCPVTMRRHMKTLGLSIKPR